jgi:hypothetical protein
MADDIVQHMQKKLKYMDIILQSFSQTAIACKIFFLSVWINATYILDSFFPIISTYPNKE